MKKFKINTVFFTFLSLTIFNMVQSQLFSKELKSRHSLQKNEKSSVSTTTMFNEKGHAYVSFRTGVNFLHASEKDSLKIYPNVGYTLGGAVGYRWNNKINLSLEEEFIYRYNGTRCVEFLERKIASCGHLSSLSALTNILYKIPYSFSRCSIAPYVGVGIGYSYQHANACPYVLPNNGKKGGFGWQAIVGLEQTIYDFFEIGVDYRFHQGPLQYLYDQTVNFSFTYRF